jgi:hypothetical protein
MAEATVLPRIQLYNRAPPVSFDPHHRVGPAARQEKQNSKNRNPKHSQVVPSRVPATYLRPQEYLRHFEPYNEIRIRIYRRRGTSSRRG